jgi:hypothetical protein
VIEIRELERQSIVAPIGFRFWDSLTNQVISNGLSVTVAPVTDPRRLLTVSPSRGGVFGVQHLPGLRAWERGAGDGDFWSAPQPAIDLRIDVVDLEGRFVPFTFRTSAPRRGLITWAQLGGSPISSVSFVPLHSAPTRVVPGGAGVLRAQLVDAVTGAAAAWALLEVDVPGLGQARSIADDKGRVAVLFPYPTPPVESLFDSSPLQTSPLTSPQTAGLTQQTWLLPVRAAYRPLMPPPLRPDLESVFEQPPALLWADQARTSPLTLAPLQFGQETVLRSLDVIGRPRPSELLVQAGSPL